MKVEVIITKKGLNTEQTHCSKLQKKVDELLEYLFVIKFINTVNNSKMIATYIYYEY